MRNVLVIDDDAAFVEIVRGALDKSAYTVTGASDGMKGLESIKAARPDVILLDIKMPGMGGIAFLQRLKEISPAPPIPIVIMSNDSSLETISESAELGIRSYMIKSDEPMSKIVELIERQFPKK